MCDACRRCNNCTHLDYCKDYISQPQIYTTNLKDKCYNRNLSFYYGYVKNKDNKSVDKKLEVCYGYYHDIVKNFNNLSLKEFEKITSKLKEEIATYYLKEIEKVKILFEL